VRPVELVGLARREPQRDEDRPLLRLLSTPLADVALHAVVGGPRRATARTCAAPSAARVPAACCSPPASRRAARQMLRAAAAAGLGAHSETRSTIPGSPCEPSAARSEARERSGESASYRPKTPA